VGNEECMNKMRNTYNFPRNLQEMQGLEGIDVDPSIILKLILK
jgi:hypothetical protein